jgi:hypothetical protein
MSGTLTAVTVPWPAVNVPYSVNQAQTCTRFFLCYQAQGVPKGRRGEMGVGSDI